MTNEDVLAKITSIIADQLDKDASIITPATNFKEDLDADSLDVFEVIDKIEDAFNIEIDSDESIATVGDLVSYVTKQLAA
ncbi:acyl carrier protein [Schleiferilactobacillus harbinensis]|uniref:acyl carrier protein n=1 Tax=Schleiferilactobacillus harbinensis TaxID=304207 RepID=UPI0007B879F9|nr:acyl carrier protein [Schleiferilactobacillus harbinensis]